MFISKRDRIMKQVQREREAREKGEKPWTQVHMLYLPDDARSRYGFIRRGRTLACPKKLKEPGEFGTQLVIPTDL